MAPSTGRVTCQRHMLLISAVSSTLVLSPFEINKTKKLRGLCVKEKRGGGGCSGQLSCPIKRCNRDNYSLVPCVINHKMTD